MSKPIVFLSHSSHDKKELIAIKKMLDERAAGSIDFFLSSDGESITFGRNWDVSISDALAEAKLMFVFLSPHSVNSRWIHFEAGNASARRVQVVPVCLPGLNLEKVSPPLSLLQGFNLHSAATMGNLARICNETLKLKMREEFNEAEFDQIHPDVSGVDGFFGQYTRLIDCVDCHASPPFNRDELSAEVEKFKAICQTKQADWCKYPLGQNPSETFETHGATLTFSASFNDNGEQRMWVSASFGAQLFLLNSPIVEEFGKALGVQAWLTTLRFNEFVTTPGRMDLTTKLFKTGIRLKGQNLFEFEGHNFTTNTNRGTNICASRPTIPDPWLVRLIHHLFDVGFLVEGNTDGLTDVDRLADVLKKRSTSGWVV